MLATKGKTSYHFTVRDAKDAELKIQSWLEANSFQPMQEDGTVFYRGGDVMTGYRFLEYHIAGSQVTLQAYLGSFKSPRALADGFVGAMAIIPYKNALAPLLEELEDKPGVEPPLTMPQSGAIVSQPQATQQAQPQTTQQIQSQMAQSQAIQQTSSNFQQAADKRNSTCAEISFWVSILMLLVACVGIAAGALIVIFNYYLAAQGLKSNKKGKAIAAIVMSSIAVVIIIVQLIVIVIN